jgi:hypothetical protein
MALKLASVYRPTAAKPAAWLIRMETPKGKSQAPNKRAIRPKKKTPAAGVLFHCIGFPPYLELGALV